MSELMREDGSWDVNRLESIFLPIDVEKILQIRPSSHQEEDFVAWHPDKNGRFSVRSAYKLAEQLAQEEESSSSSGVSMKKAWDSIWKCNVPNKVRVFAWKAASDCLATMVNKKKRMMASSDTCTICGVDSEDTAHALLWCPHSRALFKSMEGLHCSSPGKDNSAGLKHRMFDLLDMNQAHLHRMLLMVLWRNWFVRNEIVHDKPAPPTEVSRRFLESYVNSLLVIKQHPHIDLVKGKHVINTSPILPKAQPRMKNDGVCRWEKPTRGWMKVNIDGSYDSRNGIGGIGLVMRDCTGRAFFASSRHLERCNSALEAELQACREGLILGLQYTLLPIVLETDCLEAMLLIQSTEKVMSTEAFIVREIKDLVQGNREIKLNKAQRSQNRISHWLANKARCEHISEIWLENNCNHILQLVNDDAG